jgi:hypothetical protein
MRRPRYKARTLFYIASNPVRAGLVDHPLEYEFNSVTYVRHGLDPGLLDLLPRRFQEASDRFLADYPMEGYCRKDIRCSLINLSTFLFTQAFKISLTLFYLTIKPGQLGLDTL